MSWGSLSLTVQTEIFHRLPHRLTQRLNLADFCLTHCNIFAPFTESAQKAADGKTRPTAVIEARIFQRLLCSETMKVNANIENPVVIKRILDHLDQRAGRQPLALRPLARAPPLGELPGLTE